MAKTNRAAVIFGWGGAFLIGAIVILALLIGIKTLIEVLFS